MEMPEIFYEEMFDNIMKSFKKLFLLCAAVMLLATPGWAGVQLANDSKDIEISGDITGASFDVYMHSADISADKTAPVTIKIDGTLKLSGDNPVLEIKRVSGDKVVIEGTNNAVITASADRAIVISGDAKASHDLTVTIKNLTIAGGRGKDVSGGIKVINASLILQNVVFSGDVVSDDGGAVKLEFNTSADKTIGAYKVSFDNVAFNNNVASTDNGGAVSLIVSGDAKVSADIHNATFYNNTASKDQFGAGLYVIVSSDASADATVNVVNASFADNKGNGAYFGGNRAIKAHIVNSTFVNNSADLGAELYIVAKSKDETSSSDIRIVNTIILNKTMSDDYFVISGDCSADVKIVKSFFDPRALSGDLKSADVISVLSGDTFGELKFASIDIASFDQYVNAISKDVASEVSGGTFVKHTFYAPKDLLKGAGAKTFDGVYKKGIAAPTDDIIGQERDATITVGAYEAAPKPKDAPAADKYEITTTGSFDVTSGDKVEITFTLSPDVTGATWSADVTSGDFATIGVTLSGDKITGTAKTGSVVFTMSALSSDTVLASKDYTITVKASTPADEKKDDEKKDDEKKADEKTDDSTAATLTGSFSTKAFTFTQGTASSDTFTLTVLSSDKSTKITDATITWSNTTISASGLSFSGSGYTGTVTTTAALTAGTYSFDVTANAVSGTASGDIKDTITVTVKSSGGGATPADDNQGQPTGATIGEKKPDGTQDYKLIQQTSLTDLLAGLAKLDGATLNFDADTVANITGLTNSNINSLFKAVAFGTLNLSKLAKEVTTLDLTGSINIKVLAVAGNKNVQSFKLDANSNIPTINAKGCTALATVTIKDNKNIKDLDIGGTAVQEVDFEGTAVETFQAEQSTSLGELKNIEACKDSLTTLQTDGCALIIVDLSKFTKLTSVDLGAQAPKSKRFSRKFTWYNFFFVMNGMTPPSTITASSDLGSRLTGVEAVDDAGTKLEVTSDDEGNVSINGDFTAMEYNWDSGAVAASGSSLTAGIMASASSVNPSMNVTMSGTTTGGDETDPGSSGGGCDTGFGLLAVSACVALFINRKKH